MPNPGESQGVSPLEWQKCPICCGSGRLWDTLMPTQTNVCHGCSGGGMVVRPNAAIFTTFPIGGPSG